MENEFDVWSIGVQPVKIEIMTAVKGLSFYETYKQSLIYNEDGFAIRLIHLNHPIAAKKLRAVIRISTILIN